MKPTPILAALASALTLGACAPSTHFVADPIVAGVRVDAPPAGLTAPCDIPAPLTSGSTASVKKALAGAYVALRVCRNRHGGLVRFLENRDGAIRGGGPLVLGGGPK